jgi:glycosyltransferase involved in cell wall biosynthesis
MIKISVIMPSFLGEYPGCMPNRESCFISAIESFLNCKYENSELIIVSDGCDKTADIVIKKYKRQLEDEKIRIIGLPKHELFDGAVRQAGVDVAEGSWILYLDSDDLLSPFHLHNLAACVEDTNIDWVYFNAYWYLKELNKKVIPFSPELEKGKINTGCIAHKKGVNAHWNGFIGKQENWFFIEQLIKNHPNHKKIFGMGYLIQNAEVIKMEKQ